MESERFETDVVIAGAGLAGLVSARRAQEFDAEVVVLEKGTRLGGTTLLSGGYLLTYSGACHEESDLPPSEPLEDGISWLVNQGVEFEEDVNDQFTGDGKIFNPERFVDTMARKVQERGGEFYLETPLKSISAGENGRIESVQAQQTDGTLLEIDTNAVILATGGFPGSERLIEQFVTQNTENLYLRANPWSTGDGLQLGIDVGAKTTSGLSRIDGHPMVASSAPFSEMEFAEAGQFFGPWGIVLNKEGDRFADESIEPLATSLVNDIAKKADGIAFLIADSRVYDSEIVFGQRPRTMLEQAKELRAPVVEADSLDEFGDKLRQLGVNGNNAIETIQSYNKSIRNDSTIELSPPRETNREPLDSPPFYAVTVHPGIHLTMGGLAVNEHSQVLSQTSSASTIGREISRSVDLTHHPIPGLYAVGADVGNPHREYYIGGLAQGLATGRAAGKHAARSTSKQ